MLNPFKELFQLPPTDCLDTFKEIWENCWLYCLISSLFVHTVASLVAFGKLRKHSWGRFLPIVIFLCGLITPLTFGVATSAAIAGIYQASNSKMAPIYALVWGTAQTVTVAIMSVTRFLFTL